MIHIEPAGQGNKIVFFTVGAPPTTIYVKYVSHIKIAVAHHELKDHDVETCAICSYQKHSEVRRN